MVVCGTKAASAWSQCFDKALVFALTKTSHLFHTRTLRDEACFVRPLTVTSKFQLPLKYLTVKCKFVYPKHNIDSFISCSWLLQCISRASVLWYISNVLPAIQVIRRRLIGIGTSLHGCMQQRMLTCLIALSYRGVWSFGMVKVLLWTRNYDRGEGHVNQVMHWKKNIHAVEV